MNVIKFLIRVNLLACIVLVFWYPHLMISPGKLIAEHQDLTTDCWSCHSIFRGSSSEKCIACHAVADIGLVTTQGVKLQKETNVSFHQTLVKQDCVACHTDHQGMKVYRSIQRFSHESLSLSLRNQCDTCHQKPTDALHQKMAGNCSQCHSETQWKPARFVDHDKYFRFDRHHESDCATCHLNNDYSQYSCYECHEHSPSEIREEHVEEGIYDYDNCTECHRSGDEDEAKRLWQSKGRQSSNDSRPFNGHDFDRRRHDDHDDHDDAEVKGQIAENAKVKGRITAINDNLITIKVYKAKRFQLNSDTVQADIQNAQFEHGSRADLRQDALVEIEGRWDGNRLYAREVEFEDDD